MDSRHCAFSSPVILVVSVQTGDRSSLHLSWFLTTLVKYFTLSKLYHKLQLSLHLFVIVQLNLLHHPNSHHLRWKWRRRRQWKWRRSLKLSSSQMNLQRRSTRVALNQMPSHLRLLRLTMLPLSVSSQSCSSRTRSIFWCTTRCLGLCTSGRR